MKKVYVIIYWIIVSALLIAGYFIVNYKENLGGKTIQKAGVSEIYPNPQITPGVINPDVTQANIQQTICVSGWTKTIRPASSYTTALKKAQLSNWIYTTVKSPNGISSIKNQFYSDQNPADYEEDHLISLELGGHPTDPANLWPESYVTTPNARDKDQVENYLHKEVCAGRMSLFIAQELIVDDWYAIYQTMKGKLGGVSSDTDDE